GRPLVPADFLDRDDVGRDGSLQAGAVTVKQSPAADVETRERVLDAAMRLFAARGFQHVTVREICAAAEANVAAVNYHFCDKLELYKDVLARAINTMAATTDAARRAGEGKPAEARLA